MADVITDLQDDSIRTEWLGTTGPVAQGDDDATDPAEADDDATDPDGADDDASDSDSDTTDA
jgi:hypothetical protein